MSTVNPSSRFERSAGLLGDRVEGRRRVRVVDPERAVPRDEMIEVLGGDRPPAADVRVVRGDVGEPVGRAVRHQDHYRIRHAATPASVRSRTSAREPREDVRVRLGQDSVAEVEDVAGTACRAAEHVECFALDDFPRREEDGRIEVPLDGALGRVRPALVEGDPPVEAESVAPGGNQLVE